MLILDGLKWSLTLLQRCFRRRSSLSPITSALSKGLASLPDELLSAIFEYAAPPSPDEGSRQAVWLSHVSRRFRSVAPRKLSRNTMLMDDSGWERYGGRVGTFIGHSGQYTDLHIIIHGSMDAGELRNFLNVCLPMASRWSSLTVPSSVDLDELFTVDAVLQDMFDCRSKELVLPRLHTFDIKQYRSIADTGVDTWATEKFVPDWTTPGLHAIHCDEYIPVYSPSYTLLRSVRHIVFIGDSRVSCST